MVDVQDATFSDAQDPVLSEALDGLLAADRLLRERDNVDGPDSPEAASYYTDEYLADWRSVRAAIARASSALERDVDLDELAPSSPRF